MKPRILFMGTPDFAVPSLQVLLDHHYPVCGVVCQPDRPQGRHLHYQAPPVKRLAIDRGLIVLQPEKIRTPAFEAAVCDVNPEMIVTAAYGRILPPNILKLPPCGCLNIHASLLPAYRGAAPIQGCLIQGEKETGITFMLMDEGMDTGDILFQSRLPVSKDMDAGELGGLLARLGADLLPGVIDGWLGGQLQPQPQNHDQASYSPMLTRDTGCIDWSAGAQVIHDLVRGTTPWPGAFTWCSNKRLKVHRSRICQNPAVIAASQGLPPGTICSCSPDAVSVACGQGVLDLLEIQSESGKRLLCRDCAHNYRLGQKMEAKKYDA
jgi:methionyl-tRNA formyltransferase